MTLFMALNMEKLKAKKAQINREKGEQARKKMAEKAAAAAKSPKPTPEQVQEAADNAAVARLAALPPLEYERRRDEEAKAMNVRPFILDKLVRRARSFLLNGQLQGEELNLPEIEPWPEPVNGAEVLDAVSRVFNDHVMLPESAADVLALWCAHAHVYDCFEHTPRLNFRSPEKRCGKTTALKKLRAFVPRPLLSELLTEATVFRTIQEYKPTLLADEVNNWMHDKPELLAVLNGGHEKGAVVPRCAGDEHKVRLFNVFAPVALAGIGSLPDQLHDRCIVINLERAGPGDLLQPRLDQYYVKREKELARKLTRFCLDSRAAFATADPEVPAQRHSRLFDNWRPLYAIAQVAGAGWLERVNAAFTKLNAREDRDAESPRIRLLTDIRQILLDKGLIGQQVVITSAELASSLHGIEDAEWQEWGRRQQPIAKSEVARLLRQFKIVPTVKRLGPSTARGYWVPDFIPVFKRYLPPASQPTLL